MSTIFVFNYIDVETTDRYTWADVEHPLDDLAVYTYVSKMDEGTSAGIFCPDYSCVFQAEILAIKWAAEKVKNNANA